jgi:hypothetical protein
VEHCDKVVMLRIYGAYGGVYGGGDSSSASWQEDTGE